MKQNGFTLIELLGVIIILTLIVIIVFPNITNSVKVSSKKTNKLTYELIYSAADLFISQHKNKFPEVNGNKFVISLSDLVDEGHLTSPIKLSDSNTDITNKKCIQVTYNDGYEYELKNSGTCERVLILPPEYQQVEYIENTGTQYIDTGIIPNENTGVDIVYKALDYTSSQYILGSRDGTTGKIQYALNGSGFRTDWDIRYNGFGIYTEDEILRNGHKYNSKLKKENGVMTWTLIDLDDLISIEKTITSFSVNATKNLFLFSYNDVNIHSNLRIYSCKIYNNDILIRDLVPCYRKKDGVIGMYDLINSVFYTNSGIETDTFIPGSDI